jgi:hypothetical protein
LKNPFFTKKEFVFGTTTRRVAWKYGSKEDKIQQETFLYRSILSSYQGEEYEFSERIDENASQGFFKVTNMSLNSLYKFAYLGRVTWGPRDSIYFIHWPSAILETADSSRLLAEFNATSPLEKFNVSISVPKARANRSGLMKALQSDLQNYFGYSASVETRLMPCWVLTATDQARKKLKSSYPKYQGESGAAGIHAKHLPMELLFAEIRHYAPPPYVPVFDETGIIDPIDIDFDAAMIDLEDVKKALSKHGLILEKTNRLMKVLIIRDPKTSN